MCIGRLNRQIYHELPLPTNLILTSKKLIVSFEYSAVNFIVGWKLLNLLRNFSIDSSPCSQIKKMLSMYLHDIIGFSLNALRMFPSKSVMNIAYGCLNFVTIVVPCTCLNLFSSNLKLLLLALFQRVLCGCLLRFVCYLSIPKIFEEKSDLHYVECYDKEQERQ